ncbi:23S rRNA (guanosine(2251)-2'-O)-methyltransferase RlmB [Abyssisolibacter fermentans]|uniref:23S rRNA (guanosine(2251)-2'-O)-methyltransferase RlmB n=1 Tax=Abyssisolibacter fermentans TaxID=1766203 RepID=UPI00082E6586|nr:23S rRNA (guanosine(2251)-2'-O)-methyltransferase RlmB [Abyssisolibacter fermentans]
MSNIISSPTNKFIKQINLLKKRKERWKEQKFIVEGLRSVREAVTGEAQINYILYSEQLIDKIDGIELLDLCKNKKYKIYEIENKLMKYITDTENPQGIIAVVDFNIIINDVNLTNKNNFIVILDRLQDPGNMGSIIRTADAFGANTVILTKGCVDIFNPKTIRSTMGSIFHIDIAYFENNQNLFNKLKENNIKIMSTALDTDLSCYDVDFKEDFAIVIGNEASGVSKELFSISDYKINIPMQGKAESLNAAIASGILMYEASRQRRNILKNLKI